MPMNDTPMLSKPSKSLLDLIGKTPMVEVTRMDTGKCRLFLKLEAQNPGGSIKDRIAVSMIEAAEQAGWLKPGGTIVLTAVVLFLLALLIKWLRRIFRTAKMKGAANEST